MIKSRTRRTFDISQEVYQISMMIMAACMRRDKALLIRMDEKLGILSWEPESIRDVYSIYLFFDYCPLLWQTQDSLHVFDAHYYVNKYPASHFLLPKVERFHRMLEVKDFMQNVYPIG